MTPLRVHVRVKAEGEMGNGEWEMGKDLGQVSAKTPAEFSSAPHVTLVNSGVSRGTPAARH